MAAVNVKFPANLAQVATLTALRSVPSTFMVLGALYLVEEPGGLYEWDPASVAADDNAEIIRPLDKAPGQAGRWIKNPDGLARGPKGEGLEDVEAAGGSALVGFQQDGTEAAATNVEEMLRQGWVIPEMYRQAGAVDQTSMMQKLFASGKRRILIPEGDYTIGASLVLPRWTIIEATTKSRFVASSANMALFKTTALTSGTRIIGGRYEAGGYSGVIGFDLSGFRNEGATLQGLSLSHMDIGIYFRSLCWDTTVRDLYAEFSGDGILIGEGCNAITIDHPGIDTYTRSAIRVLTGTTELPNVGNNIIGGYCQNGPVGVLDSARSTSVNGTYFENCSEADIKFDAAIMPVIQRSYHSAPLGPVCVKARNTSGADLANVTLHGDRANGLFDFDSSNAYCRARLARTADQNVDLGSITGLKVNSSISGTPERGDIGFDVTSNRPYVATGPDLGSVIQRGFANGYHDIGSGLGPTVNGLRKEDGTFQLVGGGETFIVNNLAADQEFTFYLRAVGTPSTPITVAGVALDLTGVSDGKRKRVVVTKVAADAGAFWVDEGPWK